MKTKAIISFVEVLQVPHCRRKVTEIVSVEFNCLQVFCAWILEFFLHVIQSLQGHQG